MGWDKADVPRKRLAEWRETLNLVLGKLCRIELSGASGDDIDSSQRLIAGVIDEIDEVNV